MSNPLIIDKPHLQSHYVRYGWGMVTFMFWTVYMYLWMPLITLFAWWIGVKLFNKHFIELQGTSGLLEKLNLYAFIILLISATLIMWAYVEQMRFKGKHRRQVRSAVTVQQVAEHHQMNAQELASLMKKKLLEVHFSNQGEITKVIAL
jgi:biofilm PGA synthesis protein PgaD